MEHLAGRRERDLELLRLLDSAGDGLAEVPADLVLKALWVLQAWAEDWPHEITAPAALAGTNFSLSSFARVRPADLLRWFAAALPSESASTRPRASG